MGEPAEIIDLNLRRHAADLRGTWQASVLEAALVADRHYAKPRSMAGMVLLSIIAHNYDDAMPVLMRVVFPNFQSIAAPFLVSAGKIAKTGHVMADMIDSQGRKFTNQRLFKNTKVMEHTMRRFADDFGFDDNERVEFFAAVQRWIVCDFRIDPNMNPLDPDAKRLTVN